ncbi:MAG: extracellular solute-binding protein [Candidatus Babeliales bacterium]|jgi:spermidine/putrescine-binding protein
MVNRLFFRLAAICGWVAILFTFLFLPLLTQRADKKSINVFLWSGVIDPKFFKEFEQKTGIKVNVTYFGGNEELIAKLLATDSKGYDLISPSDYVVDFLIKHKQLKKLDKSKLNFYDKLNPKLLGYYFDPVEMITQSHKTGMFWVLVLIKNILKTGCLRQAGRLFLTQLLCQKIWD